MAERSATTVALLITCLVDVFEPQVAEATVALLEASGAEVVCPLEQTCCGQPAWNAGFAEDAARVARTTLDALEGALDDGATAVVVPAGSCATMVGRYWPELFETVGDHDAAARVKRVADTTVELTEHLARASLPPLRLGRPVKVAWHHGCHLLRERHVRTEPLTLLERVANCERVGWADDERCCGFGGLFSVKLPEASCAMADQKLASLPADVDLVASSDSSCLLHLRSRAEATGRPIHTRHAAEVLAAALPRTEEQ